MRESTTSHTYDEFSEISREHGRVETRHCAQLIIDRNWLDKDYRWDGLQSFIKVTSTVECKLSGKLILSYPYLHGEFCYRLPAAW